MSRARLSAALLALALVVAACATRRAPAPLASIPLGTVQEGVASWYGPQYNGLRTASGERFDQDDLTAAHPNWPFGTRVKITLISTHKSVVVRINDRFGGHKGRIIDVSRGAARKLGLIGPGSGVVRLEVVN
jgi:rare lipoprotein A